MTTNSNKHALGTIILTPYGPGVITYYNNTTQVYACRIWRQFSQSITSESILYLSRDTLSSVCTPTNTNDTKNDVVILPAVPGMKTTLVLKNTISASDDECVVSVNVLSYSMTRNVYLVQKEDEKELNSDSVILEVNPIELNAAKSAKFYPLMVDLLQRGDDATCMIQKSSSNTNIIGAAMDDIDSHLHSLSRSNISNVKNGFGVDLDANADKALGFVQDVVGDKEQQQKVISDNVNQIWSMLKDEEMGDLLEKVRKVC